MISYPLDIKENLRLGCSNIGTGLNPTLNKKYKHHDKVASSRKFTCMSTEAKGKSNRRTKPVIVAIAAGITLAVVVGIIINSTMPRNTYASDIIHPPQSVTVTIPENSSDPNGSASPDPKEVRVVLGVNNTVVWINKSTAPERIIGEDESTEFGKVKSLIPSDGGTWSFTFTEKGRYDYLSNIHPWFRGSVIVEEATTG